MSFNSPAFWIFCAVVFCVYYLTPQRLRWVALLVASGYFYGSFGVQVLLVLAGLTAFVYAVTLAMHAAPPGGRRRSWLLVDIAGPLVALAVFKYFTLIWDSLQYLAAGLLHRTPTQPFNVLAPIGISFYVFKLLSYALDVYHRRTDVERHFGYFALYVSYFPQILAGPIERPAHLLPQLRQPARFDVAAITDGAKLVVWGLFKKLVVADRLAYYVGDVFLAPEYKGLHLVFGAYFYYFQIYCDFSGYSDISIGISRALGFSPPVNFDYPYLSRNVSQFWTRWHITLSSWLRDYLFLPIAYAVMRRIKDDRWLAVPTETWGYAVGMFVTMFLGGLWHGAGPTFVAWGVLHGIFLVGSYTTRGLRRRACRRIGLTRVPALHHAVSIVVTFQLVTLAWIVFRAPSLQDAWVYLTNIQLRLPAAGLVNLLFDGAIVGALLAFEYVQRHKADFRLLARVPIEVKAVGYALFLVILIVFSVSTANPFIYFRF